MKHCGSFILLMLLATINPQSIIPNFPISLEPIVIMTIGLLLLYKVQFSIGLVQYIADHKVELLLLTGFFGCCGLSLFLNFHRYENVAELVRYGITLLTISATFPLAIILFSLPQTSKGPSFSQSPYASAVTFWFILFIAGLGIWQFFDYESAKSVGQFFNSSAMWNKSNVNSIFNISTDFGPIMAVVVLICLSILIAHYCYANCVEKRLLKWLMLLIACAFIAGTISGSRNFVVTVFVGLLVNYFLNWRHTFKLSSIVLLLVALVAVVHLLVFMSPAMTQKFGKLLPYINIVALGESFVLSDFVINISDASFSGRGDIWLRAWAHIVENPLFGISNGGFRLLPDALVYQNTHNIVLQMLIEAGFVGFIFIVLLVVRVYRRLFVTPVRDRKVANMYFNVLMPVIIALMANLMFDFYIDHTIGWILVVALGFGVLKNHLMQCEKTLIDAQVSLSTQEKPPVFVGFDVRIERLAQLSSMVVIAACFIVIGGDYYSQFKATSQSTLEQRFANILNKTNGEYKMVFIDDEIKLTQAQQQHARANKLNFIDVDDKAPLESLCEYVLPESHYFYLRKSTDAQSLLAANRIYAMNEREEVVHISPNAMDCSSAVYQPIEMTQSKAWVSGHVYTKMPGRNDWPIWGYVDIYSSIHTIQQGDYQLEFSALGKHALSAWPKLRLELWNSDNSTVITSAILTIDKSKKQKYSFNFSAKKPHSGYLKISYINDAEDLATNQSRMLTIYPQTIKVFKLTNGLGQ